MTEIAKDAMIETDDDGIPEKYKDMKYIKEIFTTETIFTRKGVEYYIKEFADSNTDRDDFEFGRTDKKDLSEEEFAWFKLVDETSDIYTYAEI